MIMAVLCLPISTAAHAQQASAPAGHAHQSVNSPAKRVVRISHATAAAQAQPAAPTVARDTPFPDVPKNHWAYQAVETLRTTHIMRGYPSGTANTK